MEEPSEGGEPANEDGVVRGLHRGEDPGPIPPLASPSSAMPASTVSASPSLGRYGTMRARLGRPVSSRTWGSLRHPGRSLPRGAGGRSGRLSRAAGCPRPVRTPPRRRGWSTRSSRSPRGARRRPREERAAIVPMPARDRSTRGRGSAGPRRRGWPPPRTLRRASYGPGGGGRFRVPFPRRARYGGSPGSKELSE